jgi:hypothetical protein
MYSMDNDTSNSDLKDATLERSDLGPETGKTSATDATSGTTATLSIDDLTAQVQRLESALEKANKDAKNHRLKIQELGSNSGELTELRKFKEQADAKNLSDEEKRQLERQNLEKQLAEIQKEKESALRQTQELRVTNEVFKHGQRLNIIDLDAATKLLDSSQIEYDDSGNPSNIEALLKTLVKERSWLVGRQQQTSGGATNPSRETTSNSGEITPEYARKVLSDPKEFRSLSLERQKQISQWVADNANKL